MSRRAIFSLFLLTVCSAPAAHASEFKILGIRALGMGGAHVAAAEDAMAQYWNPGALAFTKSETIEMPVTAHMATTDRVLSTVDAAVDAADQGRAIAKGGKPSLADAALFHRAITGLKDLNQPGSGAIAGLTAGVDSRVNQIAFSMNNFTDGGVTPFVDTSLRAGTLSGIQGDSTLLQTEDAAARDQVVQAINQAQSLVDLRLPAGVTAVEAANRLVNEARKQGLSTSKIQELASQAQAITAELTRAPGGAASADPGPTTASLEDNQSQVTLRGASVTEFSLGYGTALPIYHWYGDLGLGANFKVIRGDIAYNRTNVVNGDTSHIASRFVNGYQTTYQPGIDLGLYWQLPTVHPLHIGLLGRNLNNPSFSQPEVALEEPNYHLTPQSRLGVSWKPFRHWTFASDIDLTNNGTLVTGYHSRQLAVGSEWRVKHFAVRTGLMQELASPQSLSFGFGIGAALTNFRCDLGLLLQPRFVEITSIGYRLPASAQVGFMLGARFGTPKRKKPRGWVHLPEQEPPNEPGMDEILDEDERELQQLPRL